MAKAPSKTPPKPKPKPEPAPPQPPSPGPSAFEIRDGVIIFRDSSPGSYVKMFKVGDETCCPYRSDLFIFDDKKRAYEWAFDLAVAPQPGDRFVFATADRHVIGVVEEDGIHVVEQRIDVERDGVGMPLRLVL